MKTRQTQAGKIKRLEKAIAELYAIVQILAKKVEDIEEKK